VRASLCDHDTADRPATGRAGLPGPSVDLVLELKRAGAAVAIHIVRDRRAALATAARESRASPGAGAAHARGSSATPGRADVCARGRASRRCRCSHAADKGLVQQQWFDEPRRPRSRAANSASGIESASGPSRAMRAGSAALTSMRPNWRDRRRQPPRSKTNSARVCGQRTLPDQPPVIPRWIASVVSSPRSSNRNFPAARCRESTGPNALRSLSRIAAHHQARVEPGLDHAPAGKTRLERPQHRFDLGQFRHLPSIPPSPRGSRDP